MRQSASSTRTREEDGVRVAIKGHRVNCTILCIHGPETDGLAVVRRLSCHEEVGSRARVRVCNSRVSPATETRVDKSE